MFHPGGNIAGENATPLGKLFAILLMAGFLACALVFVALPFIAGVGLGVVIHGTASIREGALPWLVPICVGALVASLALDSLVDAVADRFLPGHRLVAEALGFVVAVGSIATAYGYFFVGNMPALTAAFISALGLLAFLPMVKRSEQKFRTQGQ